MPRWTLRVLLLGLLLALLAACGAGPEGADPGSAGQEGAGEAAAPHLTVYRSPT